MAASMGQDVIHDSDITRPVCSNRQQRILQKKSQARAIHPHLGLQPRCGCLLPDVKGWV